jgi:L-amino acid N-acyltransferase YncA
MHLTIVDAAEDHLDAIAAIYDAAVSTSPATFDVDPPGVERWREALAACDPERGRILLVALDSEGNVLGYAKSGQFMPKPGYDTTCELSVYVDERAQRSGVGTALCRELLERLDRTELRLVVAGHIEPHPVSARLLATLGFERVGTFEGVGVKFGRPWSVTWYQRPLGPASMTSRT